MRSEEIPEEEPDEPEEPEQAPAGAAVATVMPSVGGPPREFEYRTESIAVAELADGSTLAKKLAEASKDGWDYVQVIDAGESRVILFRRAKKSEKHARPVGFFPPSKS
jgi:hypothetical protein